MPLPNLLQLLHSIERAISEYEDIFSPSKPMSLRRAQDVIELRNLLKPSHYDDVHVAIACIQSRVNEIETGWWIFTTGRSQLKQNVNRVLKYFSDDLVGALFDTVQGMSVTLEGVSPLSHKRHPNHDEIGRLRIEMHTLNEKNLQLQWRVYDLEQENLALLRANAEANNEAQEEQVIEDEATSVSYVPHRT